MKCWGYNGSGQLGNGTSTSSLAPVDVNFVIHESIANGSAVGLTQTGPFTGPTKIAPHGTTIFWRALTAPDPLADEQLQVWMAVKPLVPWTSPWGPFAPVGPVSINADGEAFFAFESPVGQWVSVRFTFAGTDGHPPLTSPARPVRFN